MWVSLRKTKRSSERRARYEGGQDPAGEDTAVVVDVEVATGHVDEGADARQSWSGREGEDGARPD